MGETEGGLTGGEIGELLALCRIPEPGAGMTKWRRLYEALHNKQVRDRAANCVIKFVSVAMSPARYVSQPELFAARQDALNLLFLRGLRVLDDRRIARAKQARTLDEAATLASRLQGELRPRGTHPEVLRYCREELLRNGNFHAVFEATKGLAQRLRDMTGLDADGATLVDPAFALGEDMASTRNGKSPRLASGAVLRPCAHIP